MKLLWISHLLPYPPKGGVLQRSYHLLRQASLRHEVHLAALVQPKMQATESERNEASGELEQLCEGVQSFPMPAGQSGLRWRVLAARSFLRTTPYDVNWMRSGELDSYLEGLSQREHFDLVHLDTLGLMPYARHFTGTPLVLNHHNVESTTMRQRAKMESRFLRQLYFKREAEKLRRYEQKVCGKVDVNLVVSQEEVRRLRDVVGPMPVSVVENGVDVGYFEPKSAPGENSLGLVFVGGMSFYPNREAMIFFVEEVWPRLTENNPEQTLTIIGRDPPPQVVSAADGNRLRVTGYVDDMRPPVDDAAIYVCPIRSGGGTRLKVLDALAMQKPLVATAFAVNGLGLEEGVHYLRAETPGEYVSQVSRLQQDRELRRRMAKAGRKLVEERYSWDVIGRHLEEAYERAAARGEGRIGRPSSAVRT